MRTPLSWWRGRRKPTAESGRRVTVEHHTEYPEVRRLPVVKHSVTAEPSGPSSPYWAKAPSGGSWHQSVHGGVTKCGLRITDSWLVYDWRPLGGTCRNCGRTR